MGHRLGKDHCENNEIIKEMVWLAITHLPSKWQPNSAQASLNIFSFKDEPDAKAPGHPIQYTPRILVRIVAYVKFPVLASPSGPVCHLRGNRLLFVPVLALMGGYTMSNSQNKLLFSAQLLLFV